MFKKLILVLLIPLVLTGCQGVYDKLIKNFVQEGEVDEVVEDLSLDRVFLDRVPVDDFDNLALGNFPIMEENYNWPEAAIWNDRVFFLSYPNIMEYDLSGNLVAYTNRYVIPCTTEMALVNDSLFIACREKGIYEVDLNTNRVVHTYGLMGDYITNTPLEKERYTGALASLQNPDFAVDGDILWFGTFDGFSKINTKTHEVTNYLDELVVGGSKVQGNIYARNGDVWAQVVASGSSSGGLAHYNHESDSWKIYDVKDFKTPGGSNEFHNERIDFDKVIVSDEGVYVTFQDHGTEKVAVKKFNAESDVWDEVYSAPYPVFEENYEKYLPPRETYANYDSKIGGLGVGESFKIYRNGSWVNFPIKYQNFVDIKNVDDTYYLIAKSGIYTFEKDDKFPSLLTVVDGNEYGGTNMGLFVTDDGKYLVYADFIGYEMGFGAAMAVGAYDLNSGKLFEDNVTVSEEDFDVSVYEESSGIVIPYAMDEFDFEGNGGLITFETAAFGKFMFDVSKGDLKFEAIK